jgi:hypothetical protein
VQSEAEEKLVYRAVTLPVVGSSVDWKDFTTLLLEQLRACTRVANSIVIELARNDVSPAELHAQWQRASSEKKDNKTPVFGQYPVECNSYALAVKAGPWLDTQTAGSIGRNVQKDYMKRRRGVLLYMNDSFPLYAFPYPLICNSKDYELVQEDDKFFVKVKLGRAPVDGGKVKPQWITLRLDCSTRHAYKVRTLEKVASGKVKLGALQISLKAANTGDGRPGLFTRDKHQNRKFWRIELSLAVQLPRAEKVVDQSKPLIVHTDPDHFLIGRVSESVVWVLNNNTQRNRMHAKWNSGDHDFFDPAYVRARVKDYDDRLHRLSQDQKFDRRVGHQTGVKNFKSRVAQNQNSWLHTWWLEAANQVAQFALRRRCGIVYYNDQDRTFIDHFPWFALKNRISQKLAEYNIQFIPFELENRYDPDLDWSTVVRSAREKGKRVKHVTKAIERKRSLDATITYS